MSPEERRRRKNMKEGTRVASNERRLKNKYNFEYKSEKTGYPQFWTTKSKAPALLDSPKMHFPNALLPYDFEKFPSAQNDVYIITPLNNIYKVF